MGYAQFYHIFKIFLVLDSFILDPDPYHFCLNPDLDLYQSSSWIRIIKNFFTSWIQIRHTAYRGAVVLWRCGGLQGGVGVLGRCGGSLQGGVV